MNRSTLLLIALMGCLPGTRAADLAVIPPNYDESKVGAYTLPELLLTEDGRRVTARTLWRTVRRPELIEALSVEVYGRTPVLPVKVRATIIATKTNAVDGLATRTLVELRPLQDVDAPKITLMLYVPNGVRRPAPVFLGLNFGGLASMEADPTIPLTDAWMRAGPGVVNNRATEDTRGRGASAWPLALALRRALDYLETNPAVDARRVAVLGHVSQRRACRPGLPALWTRGIGHHQLARTRQACGTRRWSPSSHRQTRAQRL